MIQQDSGLSNETVFGGTPDDDPPVLPIGYQRVMALHQKVLVFAHVREPGEWCAYVYPVPGKNHDDETYLWETEGCKMDKRHALALFPEFEGIPYAR